MIRYFLDTNICIYVINSGPQRVLQRFRREPLGSIGISSVSAAELAFGVAMSGSARNREALEMFLAPLEILPFDEAAIWHYAELRSTLKKQGQAIGPMDMTIAAHALSIRVTLVTNNTREFSRVSGLSLENWVDQNT